MEWKLAKRGLAASCTVLVVVHWGSGMQLGAWTLHCVCSSAGCKCYLLGRELSTGMAHRAGELTPRDTLQHREAIFLQLI